MITPTTRYALPAILLTLAVWGMTRGGEPAAPAPANTGAGYIVPVVTLDSLLAGGGSEAQFEHAIEPSPAVSETAAAHAEAVEALVARGAYSTPPQAPTASATPHQLEVTAIPPVEVAGSGQNLQSLALEAGWPQHRLDELAAVAWCESRFYSDRVGQAGELGPLQIHPVHRELVASLGFTWSEVSDPMVNLIVARRVFLDAGGWGPWSCKP